ncbi:MAG: hypothetical protein ACTSUK_07410 [Promethearchaeota archaeon]
MELSQEILIETGLNVLGYLIVSMLSIMIYSMFKGKDKSVTLSKNQSTIDENRICDKKILKNENTPDMTNFISFGSSKTTEDVVSEPVKANSIRRDRPQIIRIARDMIKAGASEENIMRVLPISEAELSILSMTNK